MGYTWLEPLKTNVSAHDPNMSQDLRLLKMLKSANTDFPSLQTYRMCKNIETKNPDLHKILTKELVFTNLYFAPNNPTMGSGASPVKINNVIDAYFVFASEIQRPDLIAKNEAKYAGHKKIGEMHVYEDSPLEFISA